MIDRVADICSVCGLPEDLCVCGTISMEQQSIKVKLEKRKWGKAATIITGLDSKSVDLGKLSVKMKSTFACGGTAKNDSIILQGDHRERVKKILIMEGFPETNIELQ